MIFILAVLFSTTTFPFFKKIASVSALSLVVSASALGTKQPESKNTLSKRVRRTKHFRYDDHFIVFPNEKVFYQTQHAYYGGRLREIYEAYQGQEDKSSIDLGAGIDLTQEQWTRIGKRLNFRDFGLDIPNNIVLQKLFRNDLVAFDRFCYKRRIRRLRAFLYSVPYENPMDQKECRKLAWGKSMFDAVVGWYTGCF